MQGDIFQVKQFLKCKHFIVFIAKCNPTGNAEHSRQTVMVNSSCVAWVCTYAFGNQWVKLQHAQNHNVRISPEMISFQDKSELTNFTSTVSSRMFLTWWLLKLAHLRPYITNIDATGQKWLEKIGRKLLFFVKNKTNVSIPSEPQTQNRKVITTHRLKGNAFKEQIVTSESKRTSGGVVAPRKKKRKRKKKR